MKLRTVLLSAAVFSTVATLARASGIVNNTGTSSEDRRAWRVQNWDSAGTHRIAADSFFVRCFGPAGDVVFSAAYDTSSVQVQPFYAGGDTVYSYSDLIANIDGDGDAGVYVLDVRARQTATNLHYVNTFEFQIIGIDLSHGVIDTLLGLKPAVAGAVWDLPRSGHTTSGTFGFLLDVPVSSVSGGSATGAYRCSVLMRDAATGAALSGVDVRVSNSSGAQVASGRTGDQGYAFVYLDNGTWPAAAVEPGWAIASGSFVVAGAGAADTMHATAFDPGAPQAPDLCRVYGYVYGISGDSLGGVQVSAQLAHGPVRYGAVLISPFARSTVTDSSGYFALDLIPSALLTPAGSRYEITATLAAGVVVRKSVTVPDQVSWMLEW